MKKGLNDVLLMTWEQIHTGYWKDVALVWRHFYAFAANILALEHTRDAAFEQSIKMLDMALLLGSDIIRSHTHELIALITEIMQKVKKRSPSGDHLNTECKKIKTHEMPDTVALNVNKRIEIVFMPSLYNMKKKYMELGKPIIIKGLLDHWPAIKDPDRSWKNLDYIRSVAGLRTVPVEIGSKYTDEDWSQVLMTFSEYIDTFIEGTQEPRKPEWKGKCGYVAQTELFEQIEQLKKDIITPDYIMITDKTYEEQQVAINAWFGPKGTISPCHYDPNHNILCQVVGSKYIRLYDTKYSENLYPHEGKLSNTSQVDIEHPDEVKFPRFREAEYRECILEEGDALYIPPKVWHYVKSLDMSFSVSFWWD